MSGSYIAHAVIYAALVGKGFENTPAQHPILLPLHCTNLFAFGLSI